MANTYLITTQVYYFLILTISSERYLSMKLEDPCIYQNPLLPHMHNMRASCSIHHQVYL